MVTYTSSWELFLFKPLQKLLIILITFINKILLLTIIEFY
jgi:hypothetical protein